MQFSSPTILFGGSFDPVHAGHLQVARESRALVQAKLWFVPAATSPGKPAALASPGQRLEWLQIVAEPEGFHVWDFEIRRGGESFTFETLEEASRLGGRPDHLYWLVGADAYASLPRWKSPEKIRALATVLVVGRPGTPVARQDARDRLLVVPEHPASSTALREALAMGDFHAPELPSALRPVMEKLILSSRNPYAKQRPNE